jgi:penicillin-binding protein 1A
MVLMDALRRGVDPNRTFYVSRPLEPGWLPTAPDYEVHTFGRTYGGSMNLVTATLKSDNTVYAQLDADLGPETVAQTARDMGITSPLHGYPAEGLGGLTNGVSPLEMARAYATIANGGYRVKPIVVRKVTFPNHRVDFLGKPARHKVFDDGVTYEATQILEKNVQAGTGVKAQIGCPAAGKTGTVDNFTDAWFVGFTPRLVTSVWVGHPKDPYPLGPNAQGGAIAAPIWGAYMKQAKGKFCGDFPKPKVPFSPQPFFGKYSRSGGKSRNQNQNGTLPGGQQQPGAQQTPGDNGKGNGNGNGGQGTNNKNGGGTKYPPDAYESPPQGAPTTQQAPAATNGGTGATGAGPG